MKGTKKFTVVLGLVASLAALGGLTSCKDKSPEARMNWMSEKIVDKLDLNKDQESKLKDLMSAVKEQRKAHKAQGEASREELKAQLLGPKLDQAKLKSLFEAKQKNMSASFDAVYPKLEVFHSSLKPEQKEKAAEYLEKFSKWHKD